VPHLHPQSSLIIVSLIRPKGIPLKLCQNVAKRTTFPNFFVEKIGILLPRCFGIRSLTVCLQTNRKDSRDRLGTTLIQASQRTDFWIPCFVDTRYVCTAVALGAHTEMLYNTVIRPFSQPQHSHRAKPKYNQFGKCSGALSWCGTINCVGCAIPSAGNSPCPQHTCSTHSAHADSRCMLSCIVL